MDFQTPCLIKGNHNLTKTIEACVHTLVLKLNKRSPPASKLSSPPLRPAEQHATRQAAGAFAHDAGCKHLTASYAAPNAGAHDGAARRAPTALSPDLYAALALTTSWSPRCAAGRRWRAAQRPARHRPACAPTSARSRAAKRPAAHRPCVTNCPHLYRNEQSCGCMLGCCRMLLMCTIP